MHFREAARLNSNYFDINREERNYAAILFALLCDERNMREFLDRWGLQSAIVETEFGIYFEYSFLRDLWHQLGDDNEIKKNIIKELLPISDIDSILKQTIVEINTQFGVSGSPSAKHVESPSNWAISKYSSQFPCNEDFRKVCLFKWSFNIKPDIVIHLDKHTALCIEAKYESGEGQYPSSQNDRAIFKERGLRRVGQASLQKYMMEDLLGIETKFIFISSRGARSDSHEVTLWGDVFKGLDTSNLPNFAKRMIHKISENAA